MVGLSNLTNTRGSKNERPVSYTDALLEGLAPRGGLYVLDGYRRIPLSIIKRLKESPYVDVAFEVKKRIVEDAIPDIILRELLVKAYSEDKFNIKDGNVTPIRRIGENLYLQNLSCGPTAAFKDMALQQLGQEMNYQLSITDRNLPILGATSGDTGSSAEAAMKGLNRIKLFMLSPQEGMSNFQRAQMGVLSGENIFNISVSDKFDPCQDLVKLLKKDSEFSNLGAVNSINWGRISSQVPYYFSGYLQAVSYVGEPVDFIVPSGNFGNVLSGYIAKQMGLPIRNLIIATNENNVLEHLIRTGIYLEKKAVTTSSPSMDISKASNYERLAFDLLGRDHDRLIEYMNQFERTGRVDLADFGLGPNVFRENGIYAGTSTRQDRLDSIRKVYSEAKTIIDPHTADGVTVAYRLPNDGVKRIVMETALPVKFEDFIYEALSFVPTREERFQGLEARVGINSFFNLDVKDVNGLKAYIRDNI